MLRYVFKALSANRMQAFTAAVAVVIAVVLTSTSATAEPFGYLPFDQRPSPTLDQRLRDPGSEEVSELPAHLRRRVVAYESGQAPGTIIVDTPNTYLYYLFARGHAIRYGIGVGRDGFTWSGTRSIERKTEWPDWNPPAEMIQRQPYLPRFMAGGPSNPLGARAMYLSGTLYRIHGTNAPSTIGKHVSSGCIRMLNEDVIDLYERAKVGTKVVVLPVQPNHQADMAAGDPKVIRTVVTVANSMRPFEFTETGLRRTQERIR